MMQSHETTVTHSITISMLIKRAIYTQNTSHDDAVEVAFN